jgi:exosome complex component RRP4
VNEVGDIDLSEVRRLPKGKVVKFPSAKVPRLVGRQSSMINMFKENVGDIMVGKNGYVWISENANIPLALKAINMIEEQAHKSGLTDRVAEFFANEKGEQ